MSKVNQAELLWALSDAIEWFETEFNGDVVEGKYDKTEIAAIRNRIQEAKDFVTGYFKGAGEVEVLDLTAAPQFNKVAIILRRWIQAVNRQLVIGELLLQTHRKVRKL